MAIQCPPYLPPPTPPPTSKRYFWLRNTQVKQEHLQSLCWVLTWACTLVEVSASVLHFEPEVRTGLEANGFCLVCPWISSPLPPICSGNFGVEIWDFVQCIFYCYFGWPFCLSFLVCHWWLQIVYDWPLVFKLCSWWNYCELFYENLMEDCERSCLSTRYC